MDVEDIKALKAKYRKLWQIIDSAIRSEDPIGLLELGAPDDEYDLEIGTILPRVDSARSEDELCTIIHEEFVSWFDETIAGPADSYKSIAQKIWRNYQASKEI